MFTDEQRERVLALLGEKAQDFDDDQLLEALVTFAETATEANAEAHAEVSELSAAVAAFEAQPAGATHLSAAELSALEDVAEGKTDKIDGMVARGDLPKFVGEKLKSRLTGERPSLTLLSRDASLNNARPIDWVLDLFDGARLGNSSIELSRAQVLTNPYVGAGTSANPLLDEAEKMYPRK